MSDNNKSVGSYTLILEKRDDKGNISTTKRVYTTDKALVREFLEINLEKPLTITAQEKLEEKIAVKAIAEGQMNTEGPDIVMNAAGGYSIAHNNSVTTVSKKTVEDVRLIVSGALIESMPEEQVIAMVKNHVDVSEQTIKKALLVLEYHDGFIVSKDKLYSLMPQKLVKSH